MNKYFHIETLSPLYEAVQASGIFPDSKFFPDCVPLSSPETIVAAWEQAQSAPDFDLKSFVETHFAAPEQPETGYESGQRPLAEHLEQLWTVLRREPAPDEAPTGTLIPLPEAYIVPGGRFREVYYWDSYFTMLGLKVAGKTDLIEQMVDNFAYLIDQTGHIPNGNRTYYLSRSQPPFFALMVHLLADIKGPGTLLHYRPQLEKEYAFWMAGEPQLSEEQPAQRRTVRMPDGSVLNRYWDDRDTPRPEAWVEDVHLAQQSGRPEAEVYRHIRAAAESGWDFSSRWFADPQDMATIRTTDVVPVDLNCLLYFLEKTLLDIYRQLPDRTPADVMKERSRRRRLAIERYCWDVNDGFYFDYLWPERRTTGHWNLSAVFPLFFQMTSPEQAALVATHIAEQFLQPGGVVTTRCTNGQQWDAPNGWAPLQWMTYRGLLQYDHYELADQLRQRWVALNEKTYAETGKMMEKYNVMDINQTAGGGEYPNQDGFGWTNGVYLGMNSTEAFI